MTTASKDAAVTGSEDWGQQQSRTVTWHDPAPTVERSRWCRKHWDRWRNTGDPHTVRKRGPTPSRPPCSNPTTPAAGA
jgi:hypothetical protein